MKATLKTDGGSRGNPGKGAAAAIIFNEEGNLIDFTAKFLAITTNNNAEYQALILGLKLASKLNINEIDCFLDSELIVKQMRGEYKILDYNIKELKKELDQLTKLFTQITFTHIPREQNKFADKLVNLILDEHLE
jgi:ribonuclease HI